MTTIPIPALRSDVRVEPRDTYVHPSGARCETTTYSDDAVSISVGVWAYQEGGRLEVNAHVREGVGIDARVLSGRPIVVARVGDDAANLASLDVFLPLAQAAALRDALDAALREHEEG